MLHSISFFWISYCFIFAYVSLCFIFVQISSLEHLWSSIDDNLLQDLSCTNHYQSQDALNAEMSHLCSLLHLPTIGQMLNTFVSTADSFHFENYIRSFQTSEINYIQNTFASVNADMTLVVDTFKPCKPFRLIQLPSAYNDLFQMAANAKCPKNLIPKSSVICLLCGEFLCMNCCEYQLSVEMQQTSTPAKVKCGSVLHHCQICNNGFGVFLWLQKSCTIFVMNDMAVLFQSVYLDKYGEDDFGLYRGAQLTLSQESYHQICQIVSHRDIPRQMVQLRKTNHDLFERRRNFFL